MAFPEQVISRLSREPSRTPGWAGQILMFSGTMFFISLVIYFGLVFGYKAYLDARIKNLQDQITSFSQKVSVEDQKKIAAFYSQISNLKAVLSNHTFSSQLFGWLEKNTQVNVFYDRFNFNATTRLLFLGGNAKTMDDVNQQLVIFQSQPEVEKISLGNTSFSNGAWHFDVTLTFASSYFRRPSVSSADSGSGANGTSTK